MTGDGASEHVDVHVSQGEVVAGLLNTLFRLSGGAITVPADAFRAEVVALKAGKRLAVEIADAPGDAITFRISTSQHPN